MLLNRVKVLLGITNNDNEELLREIIEITEAKILNYINSSELPKQLEETEAMRLQNAFADGVRGLQVCGVKTLREEAVVKCTRA